MTKLFDKEPVGPIQHSPGTSASIQDSTLNEQSPSVGSAVQSLVVPPTPLATTPPTMSETLESQPGEDQLDSRSYTPPRDDSFPGDFSVTVSEPEAELNFDSVDLTTVTLETPEPSDNAKDPLDLCQNDKIDDSPINKASTKGETITSLPIHHMPPVSSIKMRIPLKKTKTKASERAETKETRKLQAPTEVPEDSTTATPTKSTPNTEEANSLNEVKRPANQLELSAALELTNKNSTSELGDTNLEVITGDLLPSVPEVIPEELPAEVPEVITGDLPLSVPEVVTERLPTPTLEVITADILTAAPGDSLAPAHEDIPRDSPVPALEDSPAVVSEIIPEDSLAVAPEEIDEDFAVSTNEVITEDHPAVTPGDSLAPAHEDTPEDLPAPVLGDSPTVATEVIENLPPPAPEVTTENLPSPAPEVITNQPDRPETPGKFLEKLPLFTNKPRIKGIQREVAIVKPVPRPVRLAKRGRRIPLPIAAPNPGRPLIPRIAPNPIGAPIPTIELD